MQEKETSGSVVRSLDKALYVLHLLAEVEDDIELGGLAARAGLPKSTLVRLLATLKGRSFVYQDPTTRRYRLGWGLIHLGKAAERQFDLGTVIRPFLEQLARETGETASLAVLDGDRAVYIEQVVSQNIIKGVPPTGSTLDLHCTAVGKMLLSSLSEGTCERLVRERGLPRRTANTIVNAARLRKELARVRQQGYAVDDEEAEPGGRCVAAPVHDAQGLVVAAISITGPTSRLTVERLGEYAEVVRGVAARASRALGHAGEDG
ncbi:MAG: IclR family transcriptional regulator [Candidatus Bipolaricaulaceae bacterium]